MNNISYNERISIKLTGHELVHNIIEDPTNAQIIIKFKLFTETLCKKQEHVPSAIKKVVCERVQNQFLGKKNAQVNYIANSFSLFFEVIQGKETRLAMQCLDMLNKAMAREVSSILEETQDMLMSWVILQLLLAAGTEVSIPEGSPRASFIKAVASEKKYRDCFDEKLCEELDTLFCKISASSIVDDLFSLSFFHPILAMLDNEDE